MTLAELLNDNRDEIVGAFVRQVERKELVPTNVSRPPLVDHIPEFLTELSVELERFSGVRPSEAAALQASAREHGQHRWQLGYDLRSLVREYGVLAECMLSVAKSAGAALTTDEVALLLRYINAGIGNAVNEHARWTEEEQASRRQELEFLSEAASVLGSSLDYRSTLGRLTRLLVPRVADYCIVNLEGLAPDDLPMAHAEPEKVTLMREVVRGFDPVQGPPTHAEVLRTGQAVLVDSPPPGFPDSCSVTSAQMSALRGLNASSWIVVPLKLQTRAIGTISLVRCGTRKPYGKTDVLVFSELARTAAAAIDNARIYELARAERARAEAATRAKDEFVAMVSHELRTPLNAILGWVRLLRSGSLPDGAHEKALEVIERNGQAQSRLVADLLDISRVMTGKVRLEPAQVDLAGLVNLVLEDARLALEAKRIELEVEVPDGSAMMRGDAERLKQIVWNLLLNAIKFTPKSGRVCINLRRVDSDLELSVRDNGVGMAPEFVPHVFDAFRQSDSRTTRTHGGLGVGLSIVKHLVDLHGGSIEARSEGVGAGSEFVLRLPVSPLISTTLGVPKIPATAPKQQSLEPPPALAGLSVLIVDDDEDARELLRLAVESCDAKVHLAGSVPQALAVLTTEDIDIIVSDVGMPLQDGYDLIRAVRALPDAHKSGLPAIALTAFAREEDRTQALLAGFNLHLSKPVELAELLVAMADLVAHPNSTRQSVSRES